MVGRPILRAEEKVEGIEIKVRFLPVPQNTSIPLPKNQISI
jgi:hypothetical protein